MTLDLTHDTPAALRLTLHDPRGDTAVLWDGPTASGPLPARLTALCCIPRDDAVNGAWRLEVRNVAGTGTGVLHGWTLHLTSNWD